MHTQRMTSVRKVHATSLMCALVFLSTCIGMVFTYEGAYGTWGRESACAKTHASTTALCFLVIGVMILFVTVVLLVLHTLSEHAMHRFTQAEANTRFALERAVAM